MAELSTGTGITDSTGSEKEVCPLCLDPLSPEGWHKDEPRRMVCCGALFCRDCVSSLVERIRNTQNALQRGNGNQVSREDIEMLATIHRCSMCRADLPSSAQDYFAAVQANVEQHPDWVWPLDALGTYYESGFGCPIDLEKAFSYYQKAAERGHVKAQRRMGDFYRGDKGLVKSTQDAVYWYTLAANQGCAPSQNALGDICFDKKECGEAFRFLAMASHLKFDEACYQHGQAIAPSLEKSLYWYKKAAEQGYTPAMRNYGLRITIRAALANGGRDNIVGNNAVPEALYWARKAKALGGEGAADFAADLESSVLDICAHCEITTAKKFKVCSQCNAVAYCSKECQTANWSKGHKWDCIDKHGVKKSRMQPNEGGEN